MYRNAYQRGMLTVFFSVGSKPLAIWDVHTQDGYVTRFLDQDIKSMVLEIGGTNVSTTYITCPKDNKVLGITMPFLVMIVKNLKKYFSFEVTILDETGTRRRFRVSNFQSTTQILPLCTVMPIGLSDGWNQIQFNLAEFTRRAYKKQYVEVQKLKVNANIRLRRIYFTERLVPEDELPAEYKLFFPISPKIGKDKKVVHSTAIDKVNVKPSTSEHVIKQTTQLDVIVNIEKSSKTSVHSINKQLSQLSRKGFGIEAEITNRTENGSANVVNENEQREVIEGITETLIKNTLDTTALETTSMKTETSAKTEPIETDAIEINADEVVVEKTTVAEIADMAPDAREILSTKTDESID